MWKMFKKEYLELDDMVERGDHVKCRFPYPPMTWPESEKYQYSIQVFKKL
jgi:hypothetical protein